MSLQKSILVVGLFSLLSPSLSAQVQPPPGWRFPAQKDVRDDWADYKFPVHIGADFNGDGLRDEAWILLRQNSSEWGVFVFLGTKEGTSQLVKLNTSSRGMLAQRFGISVVKPSKEKWKTACGKGYFDCKLGEPAAIQIRLPSIEYCYIGSSCFIYMWDQKTSAFSMYQMSD